MKTEITSKWKNSIPHCVRDEKKTKWQLSDNPKIAKCWILLNIEHNKQIVKNKPRLDKQNLYLYKLVTLFALKTQSCFNMALSSLSLFGLMFWEFVFVLIQIIVLFGNYFWWRLVLCRNHSIYVHFNVLIGFWTVQGIIEGNFWTLCGLVIVTLFALFSFWLIDLMTVIFFFVLNLLFDYYSGLQIYLASKMQFNLVQ